MLFRSSSIIKMYQNNYHCDQNNYPADVLCQNIMAEIKKNTHDDYCASRFITNNNMIDMLIKTKYNIKD